MTSDTLSVLVVFSLLSTKTAATNACVCPINMSTTQENDPLYECIDEVMNSEGGIVTVEAEEVKNNELAQNHTNYHNHPHNSKNRNVLRRALWMNTWLLLSLAVSQQQVTKCYASPPSSASIESRPAKRRLDETVPTEAPLAGIATDDPLPSSETLSVTEESAELDAYKSVNWSDTETRTNEAAPDSNVIVVTTVDGTMAGLSRSNGKILWKRRGWQNDETESPHPIDGRMMNKEEDSGGDLDEGKKLLSPLVSTTTKSNSGKDWRTAAVPSVDGRVFLTAGRDNHLGDVTATSTVRELVARAPFMDARGRWYVGSRRAAAAALDRDTGEILTLVSENNVMNQPKSVSLDDKSVVWVGRVDYSVSLLDAHGVVDVQFSSSEVMSANDMVEGGILSQPDGDTVNEDGSQQHAPRLMLPDSDTERFQPQKQSLLVATPGGNVAFRNPETGSIEWVSNESFDTPVAFAVESGSGLSLGVDIVPDAPIPSSSTEYLSRELERQMEAMIGESPDEDQTIFGALSSGQLFAMPLGQRLSKIAKSSVSIGLPQAASSSSSPHSTTTALAKLPHLGAGRGRQGFSDFHPSSSAPDDKKGLSTLVKKACLPSSPNYPGCLVGGIHRAEEFVSGNSFLDQDAQALQFQYQQHQFGFQRPFPPKNPHRRKQKTFLKIMSSWLPPTVALIFVLSFELGRRHRLKNDKDKKGDDGMLLKGTFGSRDTPGLVDVGVIQVTDEILGFGGHGTVVYRGTLDGRKVAVKRMLKAYHASADREISLLIESDGHPNVVRYFLKEVRGDFVYLALELCDMSLHDLIGTLRQRAPNNNNNTAPSLGGISLAMKATLLQIASGVRHLHSLRIVHRDLKPANILLAQNSKKRSMKRNGGDNDDDDMIQSVLEMFNGGEYVAKISDMGLGKQLVGQSSFGMSTLGNTSLQAHSNGGSNVGGPGSVGWQAPEVMAIRWSSESGTTPSETSSRGNDSITDASPLDVAVNTRTSRSVDIFSLGCIFHCTLVPGIHPFGEWFEREANIMRNKPSLDILKETSLEAYDLVSSMLHRNPKLRPTAKEICEHPLFWSNQRKLTFLCDLSDKLESDAQALEDGDLSQSSFGTNVLMVERNAAEVVGIAWDKELDPDLLTNVARFRTYDPSSVRDCLRLIRNKHHHYDELPPDVKMKIGDLLDYFATRFPNLLLHCYTLCKDFLRPTDPLVANYSIPINASKLHRRMDSQASVLSEEKCNPIVVVDDVHDEAVPELAGVSAEPHDKQEKQATDKNKLSTETKPQSFDTILTDATGCSSSQPTAPDEIVIWEGSTTARTFHCRGWMRSEDEWVRRTDASLRKRDSNVMRCATDPKFRTRLCNHWDISCGTFCPMRKKNKCVFAHGPAELRVKEGKRHRWGKLVDKEGNSSNLNHSGGEDTYGAARSIETIRKEEGKWNTDKGGQGKQKSKQKQGSGKKHSKKQG